MRVYTVAVFALAMLPLANGAAADNSKVFIDVRSQQDQAAGEKQGKDAAAAIAMASDAYVERELRKQYPCRDLLSSYDLKDAVGFERQRDLLGAGDPEALRNFANSLGAKYFVSISVVASGDQVVVTVAVMDTIPVVRTIGRDQAAFKAGATHEAVPAMVSRLVQSLAGVLPRCAGKDWQGSVKGSYSAALSGKDGATNKQYSESGTGELNCQLSGVGSEAKCSYSSTDVASGAGATLRTTKRATALATTVSASVAGGSLTLQIGSLDVSVTLETPAGPIESIETLNGESFTVPAGDDPKSQSGEWTNTLGPMKVTVSWSLRKP
jgi:hypothetical protein